MTDLFADDVDGDDDGLFWDQDSDHNAQENFPVDSFVDNGPVRLLGHDAIEQRLVDLVNQNKLPHGLMFVGPRGVGKAEMAKRLARTLLSHVDSPVDNGPSLFGDAPASATKLRNLDVPADHPAVQLMASGAHPDFLYVGDQTDPDQKSKIISVDDIRKVPTFLRMRPSTDNGWRVVIIDNADTMNRNAQNALLKILEEPPVRVAIILVVHKMGALLPTIRSRCQMMTFHALNDADFDAALKTMGVRLSDRDKTWARLLSGGAPGQVAEMDAQDGFGLIQDFMNLWSDWPAMDEGAWVAFCERVAGMGADDRAFRLCTHAWLWTARALMRAKTDPAYRAMLGPILPPGLVDKCVDHFTLAGWIEICDTLAMIFDRTMAVSLDKRQAVYSARQSMLPI